MAVLAAAALLDELMGRNRNIAPHEKGKELNWEDAEYCKFFMVRFCPHDLFVNTKADLGSCAKVHDEEARKLFEESKPLRKLAYQEEFIRFCTSMLNDVERKIIKGKQRLALSGKGVLPNSGEDGGTATTGTATTPTTAAPHRNQEQIDLLNERINGLVEEAEQAGTHGNVEQAQGLMKLCDQLKDERDLLQRPAYPTYPPAPGQHWSATAELAAAQEKQMEVCEVCGAFLIVGDAQQRIEDHLTGKQHMGYARLKAAIDEVGAIVQEVREKEERHGHGRGGGRGYGSDRGGRDRPRGRDARAGDKVDRERSRSGQREHRKDKDGGKDRRSGGDRDRKDKDKDKERDRDRDSKREKKDGDKDRDKERERRHRSDRDSGRDVRSSSGRHSSHRR